VNVKNLLQLRETAEWLHSVLQLPQGYGFYMHRWMSKSYPTNECRTVMCLAGWYLKRHPKCGLKLVPMDEQKTECVIVPKDYRSPWIDRVPDLSMKTLQAHFGLWHDQALNLFGGTHYVHGPTDRQGVAWEALRKIDRLLEKADVEHV
jgi:hypothetical protein